MRQFLNPIFSWRKRLQHLVLLVALIILVAQLAVQPAMATGVRDLPTLKVGDPTWIVDQDRVLSLINKGTINQTLGDLAKNTENEARIVTIHRLDYGETPESFTTKLFEKWFPTPEDQAHQTLLVLDTVTNGTAIQTGSAVQSIMPDDIAESVASETMLVPIRKGNYNQALLDASDRLAAVLAGRPDPGPPPAEVVVLPESTYKSAAETDSKSATYIVIGLLLAATIIPMVTYFLYQGGQ